MVKRLTYVAPQRHSDHGTPMGPYQPGWESTLCICGARTRFDTDMAGRVVQECESCGLKKPVTSPNGATS